MRVFMHPQESGIDDGRGGGIRRVAEGMMRHLPGLGVELVDGPEVADVIACHVSIPDSYLRRWPEKTFVAMNHGLYWAEFEWPAWAQRVNRECIEAIRVADAVTAPTEWVANSIRRNTSRPVFVVPHGIDVADWTPGTNRGYVLWDKSRPDPVCDPEPMNILAERMPDVQFVSTFGRPGENIRLTGVLPFEEAKTLMREAGVYLATTRETFGVSILQALAAGVPVVGWNWGGTAEIVTHGVDGWLARPGDFEGLARGIWWALENRTALVATCQATASRYGWESPARRYAAIFDMAWRARQARTIAPRTTIVVTAYNLAEYLPACLDSVLAQTDGNWECIVVDDASPDACGTIAEDYAGRDHRIRVVHNDRNQYLAEARNIAIRQARGRYVLPLDADDMLAANAVETLADALDYDRTIHIAYGNVLFVEPDGRRWNSGWPLAFRWDWQMQRRNLLPYCSMYRREVWEYTGGYRRRLRTAEDADFWCRVSSYGFRPAMVTTADTLIYRNREGSMSRTVQPQDWTLWYPWARDPSLSPAGAVSGGSLPVPSLDPPVIAVVIPVGPGHTQLVRDAIDSVDAQTFRHFEVIVANDSGEQLPELPVWVRVVEPPPGERFGGVAAARNAALRESSAALFLPLDADDLLQPDCLERMYETYVAMGRDKVIYSDFWEDPHEPGTWQRFETPWYAPDTLIRFGLPWAVTSLTPRRYWEAVGGYDETIPAWEDWAFALALMDRGYCHHRIPAALWTYRKHTGRRREENMAARADGEAAIRERFGRYWNSEEALMACGCSGQAIAPVDPGGAAVQRALAQMPAGGGELVLVTYTGEREGSVSYKGASGSVYQFSRGESRYVFAADAGMFRSQDWMVNLDAPPSPTVVTDAPVLVAEGPPR